VSASDYGFGWWLAREDKWITKCSGQPMPDDARAGHRVYVGPVGFPANALHYLGTDAKADTSATHSELDETPGLPPSPQSAEHQEARRE
jgi:hypothetical protein